MKNSLFISAFVAGISVGVHATTKPNLIFILYPTLCKLAQVDKKLPDGIEGDDIAPLFATGSGAVKRPREELVFHFPHYQGDTPHSTILFGDYKLMKWYEDGHVKLFNLSNDISERNDLSKAMPEKTAELKARLEKYLGEVDAQLPRPNPDYDPAKPSAEKKG